MATLRLIHQYMTDRRQVLLEDGRIGKIVRVDTSFPAQTSLVSVWTSDADDPPVTRVDVAQIVGPAPPRGPRLSRGCAAADRPTSPPILVLARGGAGTTARVA
jgi:hypothetical protein